MRLVSFSVEGCKPTQRSFQIKKKKGFDMKILRRSLLLVSVTLLCMAPGLAQAVCNLPSEDCHVRNTDDHGNGSLRLAIQEACSTPGDDDLDFARVGVGGNISVESPIVVPSSCQGKISIAGRTTIQIGVTAPSGQCGLTIQKDGGSFHHLYFREGSGKGLCIQAQNSQISDNLFDHNQVGLELGGNNNQVFNNSFTRNPTAGIQVTGSNNKIQANFIGTDASDQHAGNGVGILFAGGSSSNLVGGDVPAQSNKIEYNTGAGIAATGGTGNKFLLNFISGNGGLGIDLNNDGVTPNGDASGPNNLIDFP